MKKISERIAEGLKMRDMTQADLVRATQIGKSSISTYLSGDYEPKQKNVYKIAAALNVSEAWLLGYDVSPEREPQQKAEPAAAPEIALPSNVIPMPSSRAVPLLGNIACGAPIYAEENIEDYIDVPDSVRADFCLRCQGNSMINARIYDGDLVFIRQQPDVYDGEIAAVLIDDEATLKRVYHKSNAVVLMPENAAYEPIICTAEDMTTVRILGKAVAFFSDIQ